MSMSADEVAMERLPYEITRAVEAGGDRIIDQITPGVTMLRLDDGSLNVYEAGSSSPIGNIPEYRLRQIDDLLLLRETHRTLRGERDDLWDRFMAGDVVVWDHPGSDYVALVFDEIIHVVIPRACLVRDWPDDDEPSPDDVLSPIPDNLE